MKFKKMQEALYILLQASLITGVTVFAVMPFSCKVTTEGIQIIGGDYSSPKLNEVTVLSDSSLSISFSEPVTLSELVVSTLIPGVSDSMISSKTQKPSMALQAAGGANGFIPAEVDYSEDKKTALIQLKEPTQIGRQYELYGVVKDKIGNSLTFCVPFKGYNSFVPKMIFTEAQIKYGKGTSSGNTVYRSEFVELLSLEDGNLAGLELVSASDGETKKFQFPVLQVKKGELILVHLRTAGEGCVNEDGDDLNLATAPHSKNGVRDLWSESTSSHFNDSSDVIVLRNSVDGSIVDALMYAAEDASEWKKGVADLAVLVGESGIYNSYDISNACSSKGCTPLKSLTRLDVEEILRLVNEEEFDYPFVNDDQNWGVSPVTPGVVADVVE